MKVKSESTTTVVPARLQFRYVCHGCTRPAGYGATPFEFSSLPCRHCDHTNAYRPENWIPMGEEEAAGVNHV